MKRLCLSLVFISISSLAQGRVTLELDAGVLSNRDGSAPVPVNGLLQIISIPVASAGANNVFPPPTPGAFVGPSTGEAVLASLRMNYLFSTGETNNVFSFDLSTTAGTTPSTGDPLLLRWWPTISTDGSGNPVRLPQAGDPYGEFRSNTGESNGISNGISWFVPADGTFNLNFLTTSTGVNNHPDSDGFADLTVIPEPSTYAILGLGLCGLTFAAMRQRRRQAT